MRFLLNKSRLIVHAVMLVLAIACSLLIMRRDSLANINPCVTVPGCVPAAGDAMGTLTTVNYGFPTSYRETKIFRPTKNATYKDARLTQNNTNTAAIILNIVFWYALFALVLHIRDFMRYRVRPHFVDADDSQDAARNTPAQSAK